MSPQRFPGNQALDKMCDPFNHLITIICTFEYFQPSRTSALPHKELLPARYPTQPQMLSEVKKKLSVPLFAFSLFIFVPPVPPAWGLWEEKLGLTDTFVLPDLCCSSQILCACFGGFRSWMEPGHSQDFCFLLSWALYRGTMDCPGYLRASKKAFSFMGINFESCILICANSKSCRGSTHISLGNLIPSSMRKLFRELGPSSQEEKGGWGIEINRVINKSGSTAL